MMSNPKYWLLEDRKPVEVDMISWAYQSGIERVALDTFGIYTVSTVFIGMGDCLTGLPFFETMIFGGNYEHHDYYQERCNTWDEAVEQHRVAVELAKTDHQAMGSIGQRRIKEDL